MYLGVQIVQRNFTVLKSMVNYRYVDAKSVCFYLRKIV